MYQVGVRPSYATGFAQWPGMSEYPQLWEGLVGAWAPYLGMTGNKLLDLSGHGSSGIITGATWVYGKSGPILDFSGTSQYVVCTNSKAQNVDGKDFTIIVRFKIDAFTQKGFVINNGSYLNDGFFLMIDDDGSIDTRVNYDTNDAIQSTAAGLLSVNTWYDIAFIHTGATSKANTK